MFEIKFFNIDYENNYFYIHLFEISVIFLSKKMEKNS
jgi:hypothetical protein